MKNFKAVCSCSYLQSKPSWWCSLTINLKLSGTYSVRGFDEPSEMRLHCWLLAKETFGARRRDELKSVGAFGDLGIIAHIIGYE